MLSIELVVADKPVGPPLDLDGDLVRIGSDRPQRSRKLPTVGLRSASRLVRVNAASSAARGASSGASIGTVASFGCIRMYNEDVVDLFDRVSVGTAVVAVH